MLTSTFTTFFLAALPFALHGASAAAVPPPNRSPAFVQQLTGSPTHLDRIKLLADSDFIFDFNAAVPGMPGVSSGKAGHTVAANAGTMPALYGLGVALTVGYLNPCGLNTPHTHPRATEFNFVVSGNFTTGMFAENGARTVLGNVGPGQASVFPRGAIHFEANLGCEPAQFVAAFGDEDPGTLQIAEGLFGLPPQIVGATLGNKLTQTQVTILKSLIPSNIAFGLDECLVKCGIHLDMAGNITAPLPPVVTASTAFVSCTSASTFSLCGGQRGCESLGSVAAGTKCVGPYDGSPGAIVAA